ncbi:MAG TPA: PilZ domain-containing protein [Caulobacteraceae bacterium]|jgi:hypothetical protein|nr:PilZ domain-containing protein [Caulobacteraceae bacterium]
MIEGRPWEKATAMSIEADRRSSDQTASRRRALLAGKIVFDHGARSLDCTIRDLSETGAKVRLAGPELLPERFYLIEFRHGVAFQARVAWTRPPELGLEFMASHKLDGASSGELAAMRRIWMEHVAR